MNKLKKSAIVQALDLQKVHQDGKLQDWTFAIKDNIQTLGSKTTASSKMLQNYESIYQAEVVDRLLAEGAILKAKTSMDELAMGGSNRTALTGPVLNPYDPARISGGSSGGSAALVGAGLVRAALGTDTGDSIRKPAAYCGVVGVKPTYGRISRYGVIPYASSLDHVGYFSQNVADAAVLLEVLAGRDDRDMTSSFEEVAAYSKFNQVDLKGKRIGVFKDVQDSLTDPKSQALFADFLQKLQDQGAVLVDKRMDKKLLRAVLGTYAVIANAEASSNHANLDGLRFGLQQEADDLDTLIAKNRGAGFSLDTKKRLLFGAYSLKYGRQEILFNQAKRVRRLIVDVYAEMFDDIDLLISLAAPYPAPKLADKKPLEDLDESLIADNYMAIDNLSGFPSMTLPLGFYDDLPMGLNLSARPFEESSMFAYAHAFEQIIDWKGRFF